MTALVLMVCCCTSNIISIQDVPHPVDESTEYNYNYAVCTYLHLDIFKNHTVLFSFRNVFFFLIMLIHAYMMTIQ